MEPPARYASTAEPPISARSRRWPTPWRPAAPTAPGVVAGQGRPRAPAPEDHRPDRGRRPADGRLRAGLAIAWNGCIYNYQELRDELIGHGYRFFSHSDTEVLLKAYHRWGDRFVDHLWACSPSRSSSATAAGCCSAATGSASSRCTSTEDADRRPLRLLAARAAGRRWRRHPHRPGRAAPLPDLPLGGAAAAHDPARRHQGAAGLAESRSSPTAGAPPRRTGRRTSPGAPERADWSERDWEDAVLDVAAARGQAPPGRRRPGGLPAVRRRGLQPDRRAAGRGRPARACRRSRSASSRSAASRATNSTTPTSSPSASAPTTIRSASTPTGCCPRSTARSAP